MAIGSVGDGEVGVHVNEDTGEVPALVDEEFGDPKANVVS